MLDANTTYYYSYRHIYLDGKATKTSEPVVIKTTNTQRKAVLQLKVAEDLNSKSGAIKYARIELYRKEEGQNFRLIQSINPNEEPILGTAEKYVSYTDNGSVAGGELSENVTTNTSNDKTQTEVRDRLVKANIEYPSREVDNFPNEFTISVTERTDTDEQIVVPPNTDLQMYAKVVFEDGQSSFHFPVSNQVTSLTKTDGIEVGPTTIPDLSTLGYDEVSLYLKTDQNDVQEVDKTIEFDSLSIENMSVPTLDSVAEGLLYYRQKPHVFLGWKYFYRFVKRTGYDSGTNQTTFLIQDVVRDTGLDTEVDDQYGSQEFKSLFFINQETIQVTGNVDQVVGDPSAPDYVPEKHINANICGTKIPYYREQFVGTHEAVSGATFEKYAVYSYKMSYVDSLKKAVQENGLKLKMTESTVSGLSFSQNDQDYLEQAVEIDHVYDSSGGGQRVVVSGVINVPDAKIYLVLPADSIYSEIENSDISNTQLIGNYENLQFTDSGVKLVLGYDPRTNGGLNKTATFEIIGADFELLQDETTQNDVYDGTNYMYWPNLKAFVNVYVSDEATFKEDQLIYIGSYRDQNTFDNRILDGTFLKHTGFQYEKDSDFSFVRQDENNIYENALTRTDLNVLTSDFPYQLVWSEPSVEGGNNSGSRTFLYTSFLNISSQYGEILALETFRNDLIVFCERAVGVIKVGKQMSSGPEGDVYVNSAQFLNDPFWILKNVPYIQRNSILQSNNGLYFCDGKDFWRYSGQLENINQGRIEVTGKVASIYDSVNDEYRATIYDAPIKDNAPVSSPELTGIGETYAFSTELNEWMGPYTYKDAVGTYIGNAVYASNNKGIVEHNIGNTFAESQFETVLEAVANDLEKMNTTKKFRKFYIDLLADTDPVNIGDLEFSYASEDNTNPKTVDFKGKRKVRNRYKVGFQSAPNRSYNSRFVHWKINTVIEGFLLRALGIEYLYKQR
ncbi:hypothetical protein ACKGJO_06560 [Gracilimonas sp. Q87]|uniref:hypothetical protein n=1 Tax=Gracilimonas sp. Q87 TaxID=3384766 RepID=UPI0039840F70